MPTMTEIPKRSLTMVNVLKAVKTRVKMGMDTGITCQEDENGYWWLVLNNGDYSVRVFNSARQDKVDCLLQMVRCYDKPKFADRYSAVYLFDAVGRGMHSGRGMSSDPCSPMGVGMYGEFMDGSHLGKVVPFESLSEECQELVRSDLDEYEF